MGVRHTVEIDCHQPREDRDVSCGNCNLPMRHHGLRFEILEYDDLYEVYALHPVSMGRFNPNLSVSSKMMILHVSGEVMKKFQGIRLTCQGPSMRRSDD